MRAADMPIQRPRDARLLVVDAAGTHLHHARARAAGRPAAPGDLLVANDAATLPASLHGVHMRERRGRSRCGSRAGARWRRDDVASSPPSSSAPAIIARRTEDRAAAAAAAARRRAAARPARGDGRARCSAIRAW